MAATTPNQDPANIAIAQEVNFTTTNLDNGNQFVEPYTVSGPNGTFNVPLNAVNIPGNKVVVPLTTNTSQGAYYLKFHLPQGSSLPQPGSGKMYVTFAQRNNSYSDGFYDYQTGIPAAYRTALRTFVQDGATSLPTQPTTFTKELVFEVYGLDTNQVAEAVEFRVRVSAVIGGSGSGSSNA